MQREKEKYQFSFFIIYFFQLSETNLDTVPRIALRMAGNEAVKRKSARKKMQKNPRNDGVVVSVQLYIFDKERSL